VRTHRALDGAIRELVGKGPAIGGPKYSDNIRVPAGKAKKPLFSRFFQSYSAYDQCKKGGNYSITMALHI
jgi:hypothetical protein